MLIVEGDGATVDEEEDVCEEFLRGLGDCMRRRTLDGVGLRRAPFGTRLLVGTCRL
jgi:hypothetical protein